ncbi:MAG: SMC family ATPase [Thermomicrobiales bacterium]
MRLVEVEIENYKQYAGMHLFRPGEKAMVAIVGQNGAGKTTLFEAIEWCLYNPSRIKNDTLIPRVQGGKPRVRVVLEDPQSGVVYEVERLLKGGSTQAEIYRQDQPESPLVQGTKQVTEFVARELTGLSHTAFVATFFTRQKELSFFGDLGATQRREQVGRLLGLETIRVAQKRIGEQRTRKQAEARVKREQYEEQSRGIDFPAERAHLDAQITEQTARHEAARMEEAASREETVAASGARDLAQERFAAHAALQQELGQTGAEIRRLTDLRAGAERDLAAIANAEQEILRQQDSADQEPALRAALERHDAEKRKEENAARLRDDLLQVRVERASIEAILTTDRRIGESGDDSLQAASRLVAAFDAEIGKLAAVDIESLRRRHEAARALTDLNSRYEAEAARLDTMERLACQLTEQVAALTADGPPADRMAKLHQERIELQQAAAAASSMASQTENRARPLKQLEQNLRASPLGEVCPTCARPFQPGESEQTLAALAEQIRLMEQEAAGERAKAAELTARATELSAGESALMKENEELSHLYGRLENGRGMIEATAVDVANLARERESRLAGSGWRDVPTATDLELMAAELKSAEADDSRRPRLELGREQLIASIARQESLDAQLAALGLIAYDLTAHRTDHAAWELARDAAARIDELRKQVARRPEHEAAIAQATSELLALAGVRTRIETDIEGLAFDPAEVETANRVFSLALDRERSATAAAHASEQQLTQARRARQDLDLFETRLKTLAEEAAAAEIAAGELDRVYREFARFEKFVAVAVTPVLGEIASELLEKATDGKYDRLEFTEDYGIEVYYGQDDRFPLSQYSGGERDVMALCARLALSQVIGGQAATPIKFMVLDEVFGSLDPDRRRNLMEMLQRLMEENQAFQQLFVISHVDDVRAASMFDEVWKVSESSEGVSELEQVSVTGATEDY